jgi:hypothetical protein
MQFSNAASVRYEVCSRQHNSIFVSVIVLTFRKTNLWYHRDLVFLTTTYRYMTI